MPNPDDELNCLKCQSNLVTHARMRTQVSDETHKCRLCGYEFTEAQRIAALAPETNQSEE